MNGRDLGLLFSGFVIGVAAGLMYKRREEPTKEELVKEINEDCKVVVDDIYTDPPADLQGQSLSQMIKSLERRLKWDYAGHFQQCKDYDCFSPAEESAYSYLKGRKDRFLKLSYIEEKLLGLLEEFKSKRIDRYKQEK